MTGIAQYDPDNPYDINPTLKKKLKGKWWSCDWYGLLDFRSYDKHETFGEAAHHAALKHADCVNRGGELDRHYYPGDYVVIFTGVVDGPFQDPLTAEFNRERCYRELKDEIRRGDKGVIVRLEVVYGLAGAGYEVKV